MKDLLNSWKIFLKIFSWFSPVIRKSNLPKDTKNVFSKKNVRENIYKISQYMNEGSTWERDKPCEIPREKKWKSVDPCKYIWYLRQVPGAVELIEPSEFLSDSITTFVYLMLCGWYQISSDNWRRESILWLLTGRCTATTIDISVIFRCLTTKHCLHRITEKESLFSAKRA